LIRIIHTKKVIILIISSISDGHSFVQVGQKITIKLKECSSQTKEVLESEDTIDSDSCRCSRNSTQSLKKNQKKAGTMISVELLQKTALLGTAHILRRVLESN